MTYIIIKDRRYNCVCSSNTVIASTVVCVFLIGSSKNSKNTFQGRIKTPIHIGYSKYENTSL